ncbi:hypothetical protein [Rummeliibacillus pycnus]|uniref:hypothetical protein n=1 Tax=Rummeliibacillus pycnus TaxID=101070 RepID=UPI000C9B97A4|nr:hypothetical protein [Rummeliibacillus pycnus]
MGLKVLLAIFAIMGFALMFFGVFGKKKDIDNLYVGTSSSIFELIVDFVYVLSSTLLKRMIIFVLGLITVVFTMGVFLS